MQAEQPRTQAKLLLGYGEEVSLSEKAWSNLGFLYRSLQARTEGAVPEEHYSEQPAHSSNPNAAHPQCTPKIKPALTAVPRQ